MTDFSEVFTALRAILSPYAAELDVQVDTPSEFSLDSRHRMKNGKPLFFGAVQVKKNYVSFHLMPVYVEPKLLAGLSADLRKRMQGKSCFNFTQVDRRLFEELATLTRAGFANYRKRGYV